MTELYGQRTLMESSHMESSLMGRALWDEPYETNLLETSLMEMAYIKNDNVSDNVFSEKIIVSVCLGWSMSRAQGISKSLQ